MRLSLRYVLPFADFSLFLGLMARYLVCLDDSLTVFVISQPPTASITVISKLFPWEIQVASSSSSSPVTVEHLIHAIHETLWKHLTGSEVRQLMILVFDPFD